LERNPLLERQENEAAEREKPAEAADAQALAFEDGAAPNDSALDASVADLNPDLSAGELVEAGAAPLVGWSRSSGAKSFGDLPGLEETLTAELSLAEHLDAQLTAAGVSATQRMIGAALIDAVDDWGYFRGDVIETARMLGCPPEDVAGVLKLMQGFEPV